MDHGAEWTVQDLFHHFLCCLEIFRVEFDRDISPDQAAVLLRLRKLKIEINRVPKDIIQFRNLLFKRII